MGPLVEVRVLDPEGDGLDVELVVRVVSVGSTGRLGRGLPRVGRFFLTRSQVRSLMTLYFSCHCASNSGAGAHIGMPMR